MMKKPELTEENLADALFEEIQLGHVSIITPVEHDGYSLVLDRNIKDGPRALMATISPCGKLNVRCSGVRTYLMRLYAEHWDPKEERGLVSAPRIKAAFHEN